MRVLWRHVVIGVCSCVRADECSAHRHPNTNVASGDEGFGEAFLQVRRERVSLAEVDVDGSMLEVENKLQTAGVSLINGKAESWQKSAREIAQYPDLTVCPAGQEIAKDDCLKLPEQDSKRFKTGGRVDFWAAIGAGCFQNPQKKVYYNTKGANENKDSANHPVLCYTSGYFTDLGQGKCAIASILTGKPIPLRFRPGDLMRLNLASEYSCESICKKRHVEDSDGRKCWGYTFIINPRTPGHEAGCYLYFKGPLTTDKSDEPSQHCNIVTEWHSTILQGSCKWFEKPGYYVSEKYSACYPTLAEAQKKCEEAKDCRAVVTSNSVCSGHFRVTHGGPSFNYYKWWKYYNMKAWQCIWQIDTRTDSHKIEGERLLAISNLREQLKLSSLSYPKRGLEEKETGCPCYFDEKRTDCACCSDGACQCGKKRKDKCGPCEAMWRCMLDDDLSDDPQLFEKLPRKLLSTLVTILEATTYEVRQAGIRDYLREAYHQKTSKLKMQAVALLDAKINEQRMTGAEPIFEFPDPDEIEEWLSSTFLEEDLFQGDRETAFLGLQSRPELLQVAKSCDWHAAMDAFFDSGGYYGNWCGVNKHEDGKAVSSGACDNRPHDARHSTKFKVQVCTDSGFDEACARHDQGAFSESVFGIATKSLCQVDADFSATRRSIGASGTYKDPLGRAENAALEGANCLYEMMPCLRYESKTYWSWCPSWNGGYPCKKTDEGFFTHYPFGKFDFPDAGCGPSGCYKNLPKTWNR